MKDFFKVEELRKRVGLSNSQFDEELIETQNAAINDLKLSGIKEEAIVASDPTVCQAVTAYVRANFRINEKSEKFERAYEKLRHKMSVSKNYTKKE